MAAALGLVLGVEAEVDQGVVGERGGHEDVAAVAAVAAGGTAAGDELFAPEGHAAIAAVAGLDANSGFIDEHFPLPSVAEAEEGLNYSQAGGGRGSVGRMGGAISLRLRSAGCGPAP